MYLVVGTRCRVGTLTESGFISLIHSQLLIFSSSQPFTYSTLDAEISLHIIMILIVTRMVMKNADDELMMMIIIDSIVYCSLLQVDPA